VNPPWSPEALAGREVVVVGLARSGVAAAGLLLERGARVTVCDRRSAAELPEAAGLGERGARLELGRPSLPPLSGSALVVVSPGVPWDHPELAAARAAGIPVVAELELGYRCLQGSVVAVTGTKGKSTTAAALGAMLREADGPGADVRVAGNIGAALCGMVAHCTRKTRFVIEASSFQLEGTADFHPRVALLLNLSPDHLDRHGDMGSYAAAKARLFANQLPEDWAVVNADEPGVLALARAARARLVRFSTQAPPVGDGAWFAADEARLRRDGSEERLFSRSAIRLPGPHLAADLLAAGAAARLLGASSAALERAVASFAPGPHVLERVAAIDGVEYYDDSKATNVAAARAALESLERPLVAILGGRSKGGDFRLLRAPLERRGRAAVLIGEAAAELTAALEGAVPLLQAESLEQAVVVARAAARPGDAVILTPACASFDMFRDYAARGRAFQHAVRAQQDREPQSDGNGA
jgi:UDP-N-acetylmuramoylalanine--D-glutamate ligase